MIAATSSVEQARPESARSVAALYDIHGNLPALEAALEAVDDAGAEVVVVGGDVVLGPMPRECLSRLRALGPRARWVRGNCDRLVVAAGGDRLAGEPGAERLPPAVRRAIEWVAGELTAEEREFCAAWPATVVLDVAGVGVVRFCHATPRSDDELFTGITPEPVVAPMLAGVVERVVVCGHTHMAFDRTVGGIRVLNAGSVGMPFGPPGAHWLRLGPDVRHVQTPYDLDAAAARVRATRHPDAESFAAASILAPPSAEAMRAAMERAVTA